MSRQQEISMVLNNEEGMYADSYGSIGGGISCTGQRPPCRGLHFCVLLVMLLYGRLHNDK